MSRRPTIPEKIKTRLWVLTGGRCQYEGCNKPLWQDELTLLQMNTAYIAHIIAVEPNGPRGNNDLSPKLATDISNLMLMCDEHHRLIDREDVEGHPVERLHEMKRKHEERIELLTSIQKEKKSHVLLYGANIGDHSTHLSWRKAAIAMVPEFCPAENQAIELSWNNSSFKDNESIFWQIERKHLQRQIRQKVKDRLQNKDIEHLAVFALAPQPLLMEFGRLLSDIPAAEIFQLHREPPDWKWQEHPEGFDYILQEPEIQKKTVALNLSLSATVDNSRITSVLGNEISIWTLTIEKPNNNFLKSREQLSMFRKQFRLLMDRIKARHGQDIVLHVFPAVPVSVAVEIGRVWMPKADLPLCIYDQNRKLNGFMKALMFPDDPNQEV
jgi:hypothetical protein